MPRSLSQSFATCCKPRERRKPHEVVAYPIKIQLILALEARRKVLKRRRRK